MTTSRVRGLLAPILFLAASGVSAQTPTRNDSPDLSGTSWRLAGGRNRLSGSYEVSGDRLTFRQVAGTMMACIDGMETEKALPGALGQTKTWWIAGQQLELFDAAGKSVARFEAGPPVPAAAR